MSKRETQIRLGAVLRHGGEMWIVRGIRWGSYDEITLEVAPFPPAATAKFVVGKGELRWNDEMGEWQTPSAFNGRTQ